MKWTNSNGGREAYVSLGSTCRTAYQLNRMGLRRCAGPLDWFVSESSAGVVRLIGNRFARFMELEALEPVGYTPGKFVVKDTAHDILSFHDFPLGSSDEPWQRAYPAFIEKIRRRTDRFLKLAGKEPIVFVRTGCSPEEARELQAALAGLTHSRPRCLIVNEHSMDDESIFIEGEKYEGIRMITVPKVEHWTGSNRSWDRIAAYGSGCFRIRD